MLLDQRQVGGRFFPAMERDLMLDLLSLLERAATGPFYCADVDEHVLAAIAGLDETEALLGIEPFDRSYSHAGLLECVRACIILAGIEPSRLPTAVRAGLIPYPPMRSPTIEN